MVQYFALIIGIALACALIMFFCMYFFNTKFFDYGWKAASKTSQNITLNHPTNFEVNTQCVEVSIKLGGDENKIVYSDKFVGIVKGVKHDDGSVEIPKSYVEVIDEPTKTIINVIEPSKGLFGAGKSKLDIYIKESSIKNTIPSITINSVKGFSNIDLDSYSCDLTFNSTGKANISVNSNISTLNGNFAIGKILCKNNVGSATVETKNGTLQIDGIVGTENIIGDVTISADNPNVKLNLVTGTLTYIGKNIESSGGKIEVETIDKGITIESRSVDLKVKNLKGGCNIITHSSGNIVIDNYTSTTGTKIIKAQKGKVDIKKLDVDNINIETTTGNVLLNASSIASKSQNNAINVTTTNGDITINANLKTNSNIVPFKGSIVAKTKKGKILVKEVDCKVNLKASDRGKIICYLNSIVDGCSFETNTGDLTLDIRAGSSAFLNVIANKKSINLSNTKSFASNTKLTSIYDAESNVNNPILTIISKNGAVKINEFI